MGKVQIKREDSLLGIQYWRKIVRPLARRSRTMIVPYRYIGHSLDKKLYVFKGLKKGDLLYLGWNDLDSADFGPLLLNMDRIDEWVTEHLKAM